MLRITSGGENRQIIDETGDGARYVLLVPFALTVDPIGSVFVFFVG